MHNITIKKSEGHIDGLSSYPINSLSFILHKTRFSRMVGGKIDHRGTDPV